jgi:2',3'-cyclic-nucleotide 2'-phosphodiesterase
MPDNFLKVLMLGDIVGQTGCRLVFFHLKKLLKKHNPDFVIINGENSADGFGITPKTAEMMYQSGADVITTGNHVWQKSEILPLLDSDNTLLRPANYPKGVNGKGFCIVEKKGVKVGVVNLEGRESMSNLDCPFQVGKEIVRKLKSETKIIIIDFHAESTMEKEAFALYFDGKVSFIAGTHTHVQTADERILKNGTAYITDLGMTGPEESVIGAEKSIAIKRSLTQMPIKMEIAETDGMINGAMVEIDTKTGKAVSIVRINESV